MIHKILNKINQERGVVLIVVLILLAVGGLTIAPMLSHMSTGLKAGQTYEKKTDQYYAADAGVENALWQITREQRLPEFPSEQGDQWQYTIEDLNGKSITVTIEYTGKDAEGNDIYRIDSAASDDSGNTAIESYVAFGGVFTSLLDNAISSPGDISIGSNSIVDGNISCGGTLSVANPEEQLLNDLPSDQDPAITWPTQDLFSEFYLRDVNVSDPFPYNTIDLNGMDDIKGPIYRDGNLKIINSSNTPAMLTLDGTIYVTGSIEIENTKAFTLNLNGNTIFSESNSVYPPGAIKIADTNCTIQGSGCIIGVGDLYLKPNMSSNPDDFVFIMSMAGDIQFQPGGDFYGSLAGDVSVELQPGCTLTWRQPLEGEVQFPGFDDDDYTGYEVMVRTWETS
ncbi:MAG: hypothetical protein PHQ43_09465 [Dehalococcoidales bacterium]|nr:hypothetical protein [Dehalococcoidales bacterium]